MLFLCLFHTGVDDSCSIEKEEGGDRRSSLGMKYIDEPSMGHEGDQMKGKVGNSSPITRFNATTFESRIYITKNPTVMIILGRDCKRERERKGNHFKQYSSS